MSENKELAARAISDSWVTDQVYKVFPNDMNSNQTVFGGLILATIDRVAVTVAERHSERTCVTASACPASVVCARERSQVSFPSLGGAGDDAFL